MDIVFVVDGSGSIGRVNFNEVKAYLTARISDATFSDALGTRMGIVLYSTTTATACELGFDKAALLQCVADMPYPRRYTDTPEGIKQGGAMLDGACHTATRTCILEGIVHAGPGSGLRTEGGATTSKPPDNEG